MSSNWISACSISLYNNFSTLNPVIFEENDRFWGWSSSTLFKEGGSWWRAQSKKTLLRWWLNKFDSNRTGSWDDSFVGSVWQVDFWRKWREWKTWQRILIKLSWYLIPNMMRIGRVVSEKRFMCLWPKQGGAPERSLQGAHVHVEHNLTSRHALEVPIPFSVPSARSAWHENFLSQLSSSPFGEADREEEYNMKRHHCPDASYQIGRETNRYFDVLSQNRGLLLPEAKRHAEDNLTFENAPEAPILSSVHSAR